MVADPDEVARSIDKLRKDVEKTRELEDLKKNMGTLLAENGRLKNESPTQRGWTRRRRLQPTKGDIGALNALEWFEKGYRSEMAGDCKEAMTITARPSV